jgi:hygromycin-B 7''-O-kinase
MVDYEASRETLAAIAGRHGATAENVRPITPSGVANHVFLLGDDLVLRIPRTERFLRDLVKEAAVIPVARDAGVNTPDVVAFDASRTEVGVPYMVLTRAPGDRFAEFGPPSADTRRVLHQVGRELARLHRLSPTTAADLLPAVPADDGTADPRALTVRLAADGWIDTETHRWLTGWIDRLAAHLPHDPPPVLLHGDLAPQNLLVSSAPAELTAIVDWGDAQWADPAIEFAKMPLAAVPAMLDGYRQANGEAATPSTPCWEARVLWAHLTWALARLAEPVPNRGAGHWTAPPASRLLGLLRFFTSSPPAAWSDLT